MSIRDNEKKRGPQEAAALAFDPAKHDAPVIVASGRGLVAENIIKKAEEEGIPVVPDESLAHVLTQLSVGDAIPQELYGVVAQVLLFVGRVDREYGKKLEKWQS